jgi:hypothetical protein
VRAPNKDVEKHRRSMPRILSAIAGWLRAKTRSGSLRGEGSLPKQKLTARRRGDRVMSECPLLAQSRHGLVHCTCPLLGVKRPNYKKLLILLAGLRFQEFRARNGLTLFSGKLPNKESWGSLSPIPDLIDSWVTLWRALWGFVFRGDPLLAWPHESVRAVVFEVCQSVAGGLDDRGQG